MSYFTCIGKARAVRPIHAILCVLKFNRSRVSGLILAAFLIPSLMKAGDTLKINLKQADSIFLKNNFLLLSARLNVDRQKAMVIQAKLYPNPELTADFNFYDPQNDQFFHTDKTGQKSFQLDQLILLGGKRKAEIDMARSNVEIAGLELENIVRQLKYELQASLFAIHQKKYLLDKYTQQLALLDTIVQAYDVQSKKGNVSLKEALRLKSVYLNLNSQRSEIYSGYYEDMAKVQLILQNNSIIDLKFSDEAFGRFDKDIALADIFDLAYKNRPDYRIEEKNVELANQYAQYQKKLAVPDIHLIASYDQRGGAFNNQVNAGIAFPLPVWNRNQGNIRAGRSSLKMAELSAMSARQKIETELQLIFNQYKIAISDYKKVKEYYSNDFDEVVKGVTYNFQKRNITLIEFVDFFESYNNALNEVARVRMQLAVSSGALNFITSSPIFTNE